MKLLLVSPDYLSHYLPMSAIATEAARRGVAVTVATGSGLADRVGHDGWSWQPLVMSRGNNTGIKRIDDPDDDLRAFLTVTRRGMVPTLMLQAAARADDLLWNPVDVGRRVLTIVDELEPDAILVDHLAFAATMALSAWQVPFTTFVPGHPSQLPAPGERYGYPVAWPRCLKPATAALAELWACCGTVTERFSETYRRAAATLGGNGPDVDDAFALHGDDVLYNSPDALFDQTRRTAAPSASLGACVRDEQADAGTRRWLDSGDDRPLVFVSFGTFLSARHDVLRRVLGVLGDLDVRVAVATGAPSSRVNEVVKAGWLAAPTLPQIDVLRHADVVVTHGGNNTVTESLAASTPLITMPFSTDQFAIAADLERTSRGIALDPNHFTTSELVEAVAWALSTDTQRAAATLGAQLARCSGPVTAVDRLVGIPPRSIRRSGQELRLPER